MTDKTRARFLRQRLMFETLESRWLLASCGQNPTNQFDVNDDGTVSPQDMLVVINELNRHGTSVMACSEGEGENSRFFLDTNGNEIIDPLDALLVANALNAEAEHVSGPHLEIVAPDEGVRGQPLSFRFSVQAAGAVEYQVDWEDNGSVDEIILGPSAGVTVEHTYQHAGSMRVRVAAIDNAGATLATGAAVVDVGIVQLQDGKLVAGGSTGHDTIVYFPKSHGRVGVIVNGQHWGAFSGVTSLLAFGGVGHDVIIAPHGAWPAEFYGGDGNDHLFGSKADDSLWGGNGRDHAYGHQGNDYLDMGAGNDFAYGHDGFDFLRGGDGNDYLAGHDDNDLLFGGPGNDILEGHRHRDLLIGGTGEDRLYGQHGDDLLIGGTTAYDDVDTPFLLIRAEWAEDTSLASRVQNLTNGVGIAQGFPLEFENTTVFQDGAVDRLVGSLDRDWILAGPNDQVILPESRDRVDLTPSMPSPPTEGIVNRAVTTDSGVQQMPSLVANPLDSDHVVVAYMDYSLVDTGYAGIGVSVSRDGGVTWQHSAIPVPEAFNEGAANPIARFDDQGRVYVSYMAATFLAEKPHLTNGNFFDPALGLSPREFGMRANNGVFVASSDDGGLNWNQPATVASNLYDGQNDIPFNVIPDLAIDTFPLLPNGEANPQYGNLYVAWTRLYPAGQFPGESDAGGGGDIMVSVSRDGGQTWELQLEQRNGLQRSVVELPELDTGQGAIPGIAFVDQAHLAIGPEGVIYLSNFNGGNFGVHLSTDGGASFIEPNPASERRVVFGTEFSTFVNSVGLPNNQFRTHVVRAIAADPSRPGQVYAVEPILVLDPVGNQVDGADVYFGRSSDLGETWSTSFTVGPYTRPECFTD